MHAQSVTIRHTGDEVADRASMRSLCWMFTQRASPVFGQLIRMMKKVSEHVAQHLVGLLRRAIISALRYTVLKRNA
jgi:hypothetical protein